MRYGMKNTLTLLLAAMLLVGCGSGTGKEADAKGTDTNVGADMETETDSATETEEPFGVEKADYGAAQVNILLAGNWSFDDFIAEELTGEAINDARFNVNKATEDLLNVVIRVDNQSGAASGGTGTGYKLIDNMVMAGSSDYDFGSIGCYDVCTLSYNGRLLDLNKMASIDLNRSWWDPKANEHLSIRGKMFFSTGDRTSRFWTTTARTASYSTSRWWRISRWRIPTSWWRTTNGHLTSSTRWATVWRPI